jgi:hypothetical protein
MVCCVDAEMPAAQPTTSDRKRGRPPKAATQLHKFKEDSKEKRFKQVRYLSF